MVQIGSTQRTVASVDAGSSTSVQVNVTEAWPTITGTQVTAVTRALTGATGTPGAAGTTSTRYYAGQCNWW